METIETEKLYFKSVEDSKCYNYPTGLHSQLHETPINDFQELNPFRRENIAITTIRLLMTFKEIIGV